MRSIAIAELKDRLSEMIVAAEGGEEIVVTRHGRPTVKLVAIGDDRLVRQREAFARLRDLGDEVLRKHGPTTPGEIVGWINEDRR